MSMSGSTLIVAINALMLKRIKLAGIRQPGNAPGTPNVAAAPELAKASAVPANPQPEQKVAA